MTAANERRVPAIVVSGFLGAGKTTLVRWLLADARAHGRRAAVVSNEFGALGIDRALLGSSAVEIIELEGGCVCCQLSNDLLDTVLRLRRQVDPDLFIVETSGLALASETLLTFWREPVRQWIGDDIGLVVVNAAQVLERRDLDGLFEDQLGSADLIVLNKIDLVPEESLAAIEQSLRRIEPDAPIVRVVQGEIDPAVLVPRLEREEPRAQPGHRHDEFVSEIVTLPPGISEDELRHRLASLRPIRAKGFVETAEGARLVQLVGSRIDLSAPPEPVPSQLLGRIVVVRRIARVAAAPPVL
ncbi:MAG TPA: GTP-binding protein [Terriglobales bacterium]|nr:GTP-binding protein [Terriglobales bacterium]